MTSSRTQTLHDTTIMSLFLVGAIASMVACVENNDPVTIDEFEALVEDATRCGPLHECVLVDTYCCVRAVNADYVRTVRSANDRLVDADGACLARCISPDALVAACRAGECVAELREEGGFCGHSTLGSCTSDADCRTGGCSGQVCESVTEPPTGTTCEWRQCYDDERHGVGCGCIDGQCAWSDR